MAQAPNLNATSPASPFSWAEIAKRVSFAIECTGALYLTSIVIGLVVLWRAPALPGDGIGRIILPMLGIFLAPAIAALLFVLISILVPNLVRPGRLAAPLNFTLPLVYCSFVYLVLVLGPGSEPSILRLKEVWEWALLWMKPGMFFILLGAQMAFVSALTWRGQAAKGR